MWVWLDLEEGILETRQSELWRPRDREVRAQGWRASRCPPGASGERGRLPYSSHGLRRSPNHASFPSLHFPAAAPHTGSDLSYSTLTSSKPCSCSRVCSGSPWPVTTLRLDCGILYDHPSQMGRGASHLPISPVPIHSTFLPPLIQNHSAHPTPHLLRSP